MALSGIIDSAASSIVQILITGGDPQSSLTPYTCFPFKQFEASAFFVEPPMGKGKGYYYLLTNAHELEDARQLYIRFPPGSKTQYPVEIEFICRERDLCLLSIPKSSLPGEVKTLPLLRYSYPLSPGTQVLALGYPLGEHTLKTSTGIISGYTTTNKDPHVGVGNLDSFRHTGTLYQITPTLNHGNSGGVLLNLSGEVVGIPSGGNEDANNINYAVPIYQYYNLAIEDKIVHVPNLGVSLSKTTPTILSYYKCKGHGMLVCEKYPDSTLDELEVNDIWTNLSWPGCEVSIDSTGLARLLVDGVEFPLTLTLLQIAELIPMNIDIQLRGYRDGKLLTWNTPYTYRRTARLSYHYPIFEKYPYLILAGGCWVQFTLNSFYYLQDSVGDEKSFPPNAECRSVDIFRPCVVLTSIFPGTKLERDDIFKRGTVLATLNDREIYTIEDLQQVVTTAKLLVFRSSRRLLEIITLEEARYDDRQVKKNYL